VAQSNLLQHPLSHRKNRCPRELNDPTIIRVQTIEVEEPPLSGLGSDVLCRKRSRKREFADGFAIDVLISVIW
jgi:hypothetical protein